MSVVYFPVLFMCYAETFKTFLNMKAELYFFPEVGIKLAYNVSEGNGKIFETELRKLRRVKQHVHTRS
jgi:hypothetical protein